MQGNLKNISELIVDEFRDHIDQVVKVINDDKDFENAIQEAIEVRIGQVHNMKIWGELDELYGHQGTAAQRAAATIFFKERERLKSRNDILLMIFRVYDLSKRQGQTLQGGTSWKGMKGKTSI